MQEFERGSFSSMTHKTKQRADSGGLDFKHPEAEDAKQAPPLPQDGEDGEESDGAECDEAEMQTGRRSSVCFQAW